LALAGLSPVAPGPEQTLSQLDGRFKSTVHPFLQTYCIQCHGANQPEAGFDLTTYSSTTAVIKDGRRWSLLCDRLKAQEMPPRDAAKHPSAEVRREAIDWFESLRDYETHQNAGDPGVVLARRLSNEELNYSIRDLTGADIQPAKEFPVDPGNTAGFDNSGETLVMSPSWANKYLKAAHDVADCMVLKPDGFAFAPYSMVAETNRDKYCVQQIVDFYHTQDIEYADYFLAAWQFKNRAALGKPAATLEEIAATAKVSPEYLATIWKTMEGMQEEVGPMVALQTMWHEMPAGGTNQLEGARKAADAMSVYVVQLRKKVEPRFLNIVAGKLGSGAQPFLIWKDVQYATHRMTFDPAQLQVRGEISPTTQPVVEPGTASPFGPGKTKLIQNDPNDPDLIVPAGERPQYEAAFARFCRVFPDRFYMEQRGRNYFNTARDRGRYLSAGFHSLMGYFRDDQPFYELLLDDKQQKHLDEMWQEMDFVASANSRMYTQFFGNGNRQGGGQGAENAPPEPLGPVEEDVTSEVKIKLYEAKYLAQASGGDAVGIQAVKDYFEWINASIRATEKAGIDAEPSHLNALLEFAARAYKRPLTQDDKDELVAYYRNCRLKDGLDDEAAMRESIVSVLMSPDFCYRIDLTDAGSGIQPLSDYELASRLSYFLWASIPDDELLAHAAAGDLHRPEVITAQARRMLGDQRVRALAVEFGGNWLDFRRFEELNTVDRERFASFTNDLRQAMFEEPVRFLMDVFQNNRSVLDLIYAKDTFVNPVLAAHYGMPAPSVAPDAWVHISDAIAYHRGGLLPMAVFLTKNAPGLRTSPVKRGNWIVKNVLGERIPPPPATVPELPQDEAKLDLPLRQMLARHRSDANCAACHARFDSLGLVFEGFGPIGERREKDLAGHSIDDSATFPVGQDGPGGDGAGVEGLKQYIHDHRQNDFINNLCGKLLAY
jgi:mono/diheme cytochrome c family protein